MAKGVVEPAGVGRPERPDTAAVRHVKVHPEVWAAALRAAAGDPRRLRVVDATTVLVR